MEQVQDLKCLLVTACEVLANQGLTTPAKLAGVLRTALARSTRTVIQGIKKRWSYFIRKVYETDPLICPKCQVERSASSASLTSLM